MKKFFQSIRAGDVADVEMLKEAGVDVKAQNKDGITALMWWNCTISHISSLSCVRFKK